MKKNLKVSRVKSVFSPSLISSVAMTALLVGCADSPNRSHTPPSPPSPPSRSSSPLSLAPSIPAAPSSGSHGSTTPRGSPRSHGSVAPVSSPVENQPDNSQPTSRHPELYSAHVIGDYILDIQDRVNQIREVVQSRNDGGLLSAMCADSLEVLDHLLAGDRLLRRTPISDGVFQREVLSNLQVNPEAENCDSVREAAAFLEERIVEDEREWQGYRASIVTALTAPVAEVLVQLYQNFAIPPTQAPVNPNIDRLEDWTLEMVVQDVLADLSREPDAADATPAEKWEAKIHRAIDLFFFHAANGRGTNQLVRNVQNHLGLEQDGLIVFTQVHSIWLELTELPALRFDAIRAEHERRELERARVEEENRQRQEQQERLAREEQARVERERAQQFRDEVARALGIADASTLYGESDDELAQRLRDRLLREYRLDQLPSTHPRRGHFNARFGSLSAGDLSATVSRLPSRPQQPVNQSHVEVTPR